VPYNTYEAPSRQEIIFSRPTAAPAAVPVSSLSSVGPGFVLCLRFGRRCSVRDPAPNTYRGSRSIAVCDGSGEALPPRPRSSFVPSCRPPHDHRSLPCGGSVVSRLGGGAESNRDADVWRGWKRASNQGKELPDLRAHDRCLFALVAPGGVAVSSGSIHGALVRRRARSLPRPRQWVVAAKRCTSNAFSRTSMK
jgi:hypothetical protein